MFEKIGSIFLDLTETLVIGLSIFLVVYLFFMQPHQANGHSMVPTFNDGDYLLTDKISYKIGEPKRGDVIVFHAPPAANCPQGTGCDFIKRVLALPGEQVEIRDNGIWINSVKLEEPYLPKDILIEPGTYTQGKVIYLQPNEYMAIGDNRPYSSDSRTWGPVRRSEIVGKVFFRYWPISQMGVIKPVVYPNYP